MPCSYIPCVVNQGWHVESVVLNLQSKALTRNGKVAREMCMCKRMAGSHDLLVARISVKGVDPQTRIERQNAAQSNYPLGWRGRIEVSDIEFSRSYVRAQCATQPCCAEIQRRNGGPRRPTHVGNLDDVRAMITYRAG